VHRYTKPHYGQNKQINLKTHQSNEERENAAHRRWDKSFSGKEKKIYATTQKALATDIF